MMKWIPIFHIWPKVTSRDEYAGNTARFCDKVAGRREFVLYSTDSAINLKLQTLNLTPKPKL